MNTTTWSRLQFSSLVFACCKILYAVIRPRSQFVPLLQQAEVIYVPMVDLMVLRSLAVLNGSAMVFSPVRTGCVAPAPVQLKPETVSLPVSQSTKLPALSELLPVLSLIAVQSQLLNATNARRFSFGVPSAWSAKMSLTRSCSDSFITLTRVTPSIEFFMDDDISNTTTTSIGFVAGIPSAESSIWAMPVSSKETPVAVLSRRTEPSFGQLGSLFVASGLDSFDTKQTTDFVDVMVCPFFSSVAFKVTRAQPVFPVNVTKPFASTVNTSVLLDSHVSVGLVKPTSLLVSCSVAFAATSQRRCITSVMSY